MRFANTQFTICDRTLNRLKLQSRQWYEIQIPNRYLMLYRLGVYEEREKFHPNTLRADNSVMGMAVEFAKLYEVRISPLPPPVSLYRDIAYKWNNVAVYGRIDARKKMTYVIPTLSLMTATIHRRVTDMIRSIACCPRRHVSLILGILHKTICLSVRENSMHETFLSSNYLVVIETTRLSFGIASNVPMAVVAVVAQRSPSPVLLNRWDSHKNFSSGNSTEQ